MTSRLTFEPVAEWEVRIENTGSSHLPWAYCVGHTEARNGDYAYFGTCETREQAYACALAHLRGLLRRERERTR